MSQEIWILLTCESSHIKFPAVAEVNTTKNANRTDFVISQNIWLWSWQGKMKSNGNQNFARIFFSLKFFFRNGQRFNGHQFQESLVPSLPVFSSISLSIMHTPRFLCGDTSLFLTEQIRFPVNLRSPRWQRLQHSRPEKPFK